MDRQKYCNELNRETFLHAMDFHVISFAYDDVEQRPDLCITLLRMVLSKYSASQTPVSRVQLAEKEIIRLAIEQSRPLRPKDVERHFEINHRTTVLMLKRMCAKGLLHPTLSGSREELCDTNLLVRRLSTFDGYAPLCVKEAATTGCFNNKINKSFSPTHQQYRFCDRNKC